MDSDIDNTDFLADYRPGPAVEEIRDAPPGGPVTRYGRDPRGGSALVRSWTRDIRGDLIPFWQHEIRQLRRLEGLAVAEGLFAPILTAGFDARGFHLVSALDDERRLLVDLTYSSADETDTTVRALRWRNLWRIARALELLHSQGMAHRNLGRASILSAGGGEPDFQLIGHEWSVRLAPREGPEAQAPSQATALAEHFFVRDWRALGAVPGGGPRIIIASAGFWLPPLVDKIREKLVHKVYQTDAQLELLAYSEHDEVDAHVHSLPAIEHCIRAHLPGSRFQRVSVFNLGFRQIVFRYPA